ncbi:conserved hypothetical protein [Aspergillus terreus NIH2624]|uniref:AB hydrolase-1 domain-containing protein n=1 Tax=Aspergillus terreus (strain NIH 2624 / FGSC A1156) TaxID=341663 RepID=Q0CZW6_ASPTN|nr:uncharacterized protein ATEG_00768 [Aspergillus terreus NIH2624]EAU39414.1 conserved hypothetical protein [Aspergillus terreus NIH2624]
MLYHPLSILAAIPLALAIPHHRSYFYAGGNYTLTSSGEHIYTNQIYVERLTPLNGPTQPHPIVLIHGVDQTATNWLNKPDGKDGWASYFLSQGYECYLLDQAARGRSPWDNTTNGDLRKYTAEHIQELFTAPERYVQWPQSVLHTQWPGTGMMGDPVFDAYYASTVPSLASNAEQETMMRVAGAALLSRIGQPVILVAHSQGGSMAWVIADERPDLVRGVVAIEPSGPPFWNAKVFGAGPARPYGLTETALTYEPPVSDPERDFVKQKIVSGSEVHDDCVLQAEDPSPRQLVFLGQLPVLLVTAEASYHATHDWCTVRFLKQAGVDVQHMQLGERGIHGNGHMVMVEKNSDEIAGVIAGWMEDL